MPDHVPDCNPGCHGDTHVLLPETSAQVEAREASRAAHAAMVAQNEADIAAAIGEHVDTELSRLIAARDPWPGDPI